MKVAVLFSALALTAALPLGAQAATADDVKALVDQGKAAEAYALGRQHPEELGNPAFDFYYGVAATDAGHAGEGVLALERYVANFPDNQAARLELGRAYFVLGDDVRAREEFDNVQKSNPPAAVQANIQRFMDAIRARESQYKTTAGFYAEVGVGHDSNVNGGIGSSSITLNFLGFPTTFNVPASAAKQADNFLYAGAGGNVTKPIAPGVALFAAASADGKYNNHQTAFDQENVNLAGGASFIQDKNLWRLTGSYSELGVGHDWYRKATGVTGEVNHQLDELQILNGFIQYAKLDYQPPNDVRKADLWAMGVGYRKAFIGKWQPLLTIAPSIGTEHNTQNRPDLGRKFWGGRVAVAVTPAPKWSASVGASYQQSRYDAVDVLLGETRKDKYYGLDAALSYAIDRNWSVRGEYAHNDNKSNLALYEFKRDLYTIKLRYEFK
jgi:hypothetical protein